MAQQWGGPAGCHMHWLGPVRLQGHRIITYMAQKSPGQSTLSCVLACILVLPGWSRVLCQTPCRRPLERVEHWVARELGVHARGRLSGETQRFYPQCSACAARQSAAVRADRRTLVTHFNGFRPPYAAGAQPLQTPLL